MRPRPHPQELLSSWLFRLAQGNSEKLHSLTRAILGERQVWNRDIDRLADQAVLRALESFTGISEEELRLHTLAALEGRVYSRFTAKTNLRWILPLGVYHRTRKRRGLMYCPHCLREETAFLLPWRLSLSVVCPKHGTMLLDACPECASPVIPHRVDMAAHLSKSLPTRSPHTECFHCDTALASAITEKAPSNVLQWQQELSVAIFDSGLMKVKGVGMVPVVEYLNVARVWVTLLSFGRRAERLRELVDFPVKLESGVHGRSFDNLDLPTRLLAVQHLVMLFEDWPDRMVGWSQAARIRRSTLLNDLSDPPPWYLDALRPMEYVNPRGVLRGEITAGAGNEFSPETIQLLQQYQAGKPVRQLAEEFGIAPSTVRSRVTAYLRHQQS